MLYPLTVSALLQACNQKTSREPVTDYSETVVVETLDRLRADALVFRVHGSRSERYEHCLDRRWHLDTRGAAAVVAMLLLRGAQTVAELRARTARLHAFGTAGEVEATLQRLAEGPDALARELPRQPGQRETRWIHLAGTEEVERDLIAGFHLPGGDQRAGRRPSRDRRSRPLPPPTNGWNGSRRRSPNSTRRWPSCARASATEERRQLAGQLAGERGERGFRVGCPGEGPPDDDQIGAGRDRCRRGGGPPLVVAGGARRADAWCHQPERPRFGSAQRLKLER